MTVDVFMEKVSGGGTVPLSREEWEGVADAFPVVERHDTQLAGELLIVRMGEGLVAVEQPSRDARVARLLGSEEAARMFVKRRMEEYERMWDGCGVKVEYFDSQARGAKAAPSEG